MNPPTQRPSDRAAAQMRAYLKAARALNLPIGHLPPWEAVHQIIVTGYGDMVSAKARAMFPEAFT